MSYLKKERYGYVVVCDLCACFGAVFDRTWHEMRQDSRGEPIHLCNRCRKTAIWCAAHQCYHGPDDNHRRSCIVCGGLFTARASQGIERCPGCARAAAAAAGASC